MFYTEGSYFYSECTILKVHCCNIKFSLLISACPILLTNRLGVKEENLPEYYRKKEENYRKVLKPSDFFFRAAQKMERLDSPVYTTRHNTVISTKHSSVVLTLV